MQPLNIAATLDALSQARLGSYRRLLAPADDRELYGLYCWNEAVSSCLNSLINNVEISMRNAFHRELSLRFGAARGSVSSDWYNELELAPKSADKVLDVTHRRGRGGVRTARVPMPTPDDVVSRLTLGFWKHLFDAERTIAGARVDWGSIVPSLLPNHANRDPLYWAKQKSQDKLFGRIDLVGDIRNRIAHLEPVWKAGPLLEEGRQRMKYRPGIVQGAPGNAAESIDRLRLFHQRILELLYWISSCRADDYRRSAIHAKFRHLVTAEGMAAYKGLAQNEELSLLAVHKRVRDRRPLEGMVQIKSRGKVLAVVVPWSTFHI